ncbi:MAG TPA: hypothetical protein DEB17_06530 [Chlorobaculum sp.]|nr:hypothetical protein [Chlorobaculum sp.]
MIRHHGAEVWGVDQIEPLGKSAGIGLVVSGIFCRKNNDQTLQPFSKQMVITLQGLKMVGCTMKRGAAFSLFRVTVSRT